MDNETNQSDVVSWFKSDIRYEGHGRAEFLDPPGWVEGPAIATVDARGIPQVRMEIEDFGSDESLEFGLFQIISGQRPVREPFSMIAFGGYNNVCTRIVVDTPEGAFTAIGSIDYSASGLELLSLTWEELHFRPLRAKYQGDIDKPAKYWVLPLTNLTCDFLDDSELLNKHPLRINPNQAVDSDLILFDFEGSVGFLEPLPKFETLRKNLLDVPGQMLVTSIMVGEVGKHTVDLDSQTEWLPFPLLNVLSLATGSKVGAKWIEFRSEQGLLISRIHTWRGISPFFKGHMAIKEKIHHGIGRLLNSAQSSQYYNDLRMRHAIRQTVQGGYELFNIEDRLPHIARALDTLCRVHRCWLLPDRSEDHRKDERFQQVFNSLIEQLERMAKRAKRIELKRVGRILDSVSENLRSAQRRGKAGGFGKQVVRLTEEFGLADSTVLSRFYNKNDKKWPQIILKYRNIVMHDAIDYEKHDFSRVAKLTFHLHDILLRVMLKMLDYDGNYMPSVIFTSDDPDASLDWVTADTPATKLGYL